MALAVATEVGFPKATVRDGITGAAAHLRPPGPG